MKIKSSIKKSFINPKIRGKFLLIILHIMIILYLQILKNILKKIKIIKKKEQKLSKLTDLSEMNKKVNKSIEFIKIYSLLFSAAKLGLTNRQINPSRIREKNYITYKKGVGICCIGRKENLYAKEFVEYYIKLGVKKIIIYDDNEINGEKFKDVLNKYVINKKVEIIDIHGFESAQFPSYNDCYMTYGSQFDFLLFLDFDEFVTIENNIDINTYLYNKKFRKCETIVLNWVLYGDNNLVKYDNRTMIERFTKPWSYRNLGKCVVRTNTVSYS